MDDDHAVAVAQRDLALMQTVPGDYEKSIANCRSAVAIFREADDAGWLSAALSLLGHSLVQLGDFAAARTALEEAIAIPAKRNAGYKAIALNYLAMLHREVGDHEAAMAAFGDALAMYQANGDTYGIASVLGDLGYAQGLNGDRATGIANVTRALEVFHEFDDRMNESEALSFRGSLRAMAGEHAAALADLRRATVLAREVGDAHHEADALARLAAVERQVGDTDSALADLSRAAQLLRGRGLRLAEIRILNDLGELLLGVAAVDRARECFAESLALLRDGVAIPAEEARAVSGLEQCGEAVGGTQAREG